MKLTIEIDLENAAFGGNADDWRNGNEVARILRGLADDYTDADIGMDSDILRDINGNRCGSVTVED